MEDRTLAIALAQLHENVAAAITVEDTRPVLAVVQQLLEVRASADTALAVAVDGARAGGITWQSIGDALGTTRQAAFQRFGHPIDPRTGQAMETTAVPAAAEKALAIFSFLAAGKWDQARVDFDENVGEKLSASFLADTWAQITGAVGAFESAGEARVRTMAEMTVVDLPLSFEAGELVGRISLNADGSVAGLFILTPAAAVEL